MITFLKIPKHWCNNINMLVCSINIVKYGNQYIWFLITILFFIFTLLYLIKIARHQFLEQSEFFVNNMTSKHLAHPLNQLSKWLWFVITKSFQLHIWYAHLTVCGWKTFTQNSIVCVSHKLTAANQIYKPNLWVHNFSPSIEASLRIKSHSPNQTSPVANGEEGPFLHVFSLVG